MPPLMGECCQDNIAEWGNRVTEHGEGPLNNNNTSNQKTPEPPAGKKTYQTPTLKFESVFEVSALGCGKLTSQAGCKFSTKSS